MVWALRSGKKIEKTAREGQLPGLTSSPLETSAEERAAINNAADLTDRAGEIAIRAHCLRVATWSIELASALGLPESDRKLVEQAAIAHHIPKMLVDDQARKWLLTEMHLQADGEQPLLGENVQAVLETLWGHRPIIDSALGKVVAVLEISDDFDQYFESQALLGEDAVDDYTHSSVESMKSLLQMAGQPDVGSMIDRLPVFPWAAREVVRLVANPDVSVRELERVASLDPVLAGRLIQTANSAFYSPRAPIGTMSQAVSYIGIETSRRVLLAAAVRGNYSTPQAHQIWNHSLDVAQTAELVATRASLGIDPSEAFLAGLIHDVGRLAIALMPAAFLSRFQRLTDGGCPPAEVETCLAGRDHGEIGAETLMRWKFPPEIVEAVRWHHRPERSSLPLASLLYLAEFITDSQEDLPSYVRMNTASRVANISMGSLVEIRQKNRGSLESLRFAA